METKVRKVTNSPIQHSARLGRGIKITPKAHINIMLPGYKVEYLIESIEALIGIGPDHTANLIMSVEAWEALRNGANINIMTTEEYKKKYVYKIRKK